MAKAKRYISQLMIYHDKSLNKDVIFSHVLESEIGMTVHRLVRLLVSKNGLKLQVPWGELSESEDTVESIVQVYRDAPQILSKWPNVRTPLHHFLKNKRRAGS